MQKKDKNNPNDKGYKLLLSSKKIFLELLRSFVKHDWVESIDENSILKVDKSYILNDFSGKEADLVYRVKIKDKEVIFYMLLELQSKVDFQMPFRLLQYMMEIWRDVLRNADKKETTKKNYRLPVIVPCVLYNGANNWTACRNYKETLDANELFGDYIVDFKYILIDVNRFDEKDLLEISNTIATAFFLDQKVKKGSELIKRLEKGLKVLRTLDTENQDLLMEWIKNIFTRNMPEKHKKEVAHIVEKEKEGIDMTYALERLADDLIKEGKAEGLKEGKAEA